MKTVCFETVGYNLPIPDPKLGSQAFSFKPWRMAEEKKIGQLKAKNKSVGAFVRLIFTEMLESFGGQSWGSYKETEQKLILNQLPYGNIFHMYLALRVHALGPEYKGKSVTCPQCMSNFSDVEANLQATDIRCKELDESPTYEYELRSKFKIGEVDVDKVVLGYTPWDAMERLQGAAATNEAVIKESMLVRSICGVRSNGVENVIANIAPHMVLENLTKRDIEFMADALEEHNGGPRLVMSMDCDACSNKWDAPLVWTYDHFFGTSSL